MPRTTLNIDAPVLEDLKALQAKERKSIGELASQLLVEALAMRKGRRKAGRRLEWQSRDMGKPRVDLEDREAIWTLLDTEGLQD